ncbi:MAG: hypothetical protein PHP69_06505 [Candidatus Omnitrophica bacterium]|nr:hypothetical protein [Candidatus Omnitrophota bacterium]
MNKKTIKNKKWITPEIIRIKLNPEQAVLSCCDNVSKAIITAQVANQCRPGCGSPFAHSDS